jgi:hypothetical protein
VPREVTHPFQVRAHPQAGHDDPQVGGDRLLAGEQLKCALLEVSLDPVEMVVGGDDALGQRQVAV